MKARIHFKLNMWLAAAGSVTFASAQLMAQTNSIATNEPLKLLPPYGELPPTFWEQNGAWIIASVFGIIVVAVFSLWLAFRAKPKIVVPPEVLARAALEKLLPPPEDGVVLSRISQIVRQYFIAAFQLPAGEFTTAEFSRAVSNHEPIGAELSAAATDLLRDCDGRKFSMTESSAPLNAAARALKLIEQAEQRRAQLQPPTGTQTPGQRA